jgi:hypothetical protein
MDPCPTGIVISFDRSGPSVGMEFGCCQVNKPHARAPQFFGASKSSKVTASLIPRLSTQRKRVIAGRHLRVFVYPKTERTVSVGFILK